MKKIIGMLVLATLAGSTSFGQFSIIIDDDFNRASSSSVGVTNNGLNWTEGGGATGGINNNELVFTTSGVNAREWASVNLSSISPYWNAVLTDNTAPIVWTFNMQTDFFNVAGVGLGQNTILMVLASNSSNFESGEGYAVMLGNPGSIDKIRLIRYSGGLNSGTNISNITYGGDFLNEYLAIKVIYDPVGDLWTLQYAASDVSFPDPSTASYTTIGSVVNSTHTSSPGFVFSGPMFAHNAVTGPYGKFDNYLVIQEWVLPITLENFDAFTLGSDAVLNWITGTEISNDYFSIEHSFDGNHFDVVGTVQGAGNSLDRLQYSFEHKNLVAGVHYYRLKQTDFDGRYVYSNTISVEIDGRFNNTWISPNPVSDHMQIGILQNAIQSGVFSISNLSGQIMKEQSFDALEGYNNFTMTLEDLPAGLYLLSIKGNSGETVTQQFVKQ